MSEYMFRFYYEKQNLMLNISEFYCFIVKHFVFNNRFQ